MSLYVVLEFKDMEPWPGKTLVYLVLRYRRNPTKERKKRNFSFKKDCFCGVFPSPRWGYLSHFYGQDGIHKGLKKYVVL